MSRPLWVNSTSLQGTAECPWSEQCLAYYKKYLTCVIPHNSQSKHFFSKGLKNEENIPHYPVRTNKEVLRCSGRSQCSLSYTCAVQGTRAEG